MRRAPNTHNAESVDREAMPKATLSYLEKLEALPRIEPRNGSEYTQYMYKYGCGDEGVVRLSERQAAFAGYLAEGYKDIIECYVKAGYNYHTAFAKMNKRSVLSKIKEELAGKAKKAMTPSVTRLMNFLRYDGAAELMIDKQWLLNEQVSLYTECRTNKMYTQAVRLLHDISYHVDVDSRVSNKIEISEKVDYAAIISSADNRAKTSLTLEDKVEVGGIIDAEFENTSDDKSEETPVSH